MIEVTHEQIDFQIEYIFRFSASGKTLLTTFNPLQLLRSICRIFAKKPDVLIVSLWRSCIVSIVVKFFRPRTKLVLFLHLPSHVHFLDRFFTVWAARLAHQIWADSAETLAKRLPGYPSEQGRVISFVTQLVFALPDYPVRPVFIFWGRIHLQKGLERALRIFAEVIRNRPESRYLLIGPDGGDLVRIRSLVGELKLGDSVQFFGEKDFAAISTIAREASFYLQTSELEGMAMSVVEAMQLGLVPVVTPVGEIANYARHGDNAVVVSDNATAVADLLALVDDDARYQEMRQQATATWATSVLYKDSVLAGCLDVLGLDKKR